MDPEDDDLNREADASRPVGLRSQIGGGIAVFIGVLLFVFLPKVAPGAIIDLHPMAKLFIGIGLFCVVAGTIARLFYAD